MYGEFDAVWDYHFSNIFSLSIGELGQGIGMVIVFGFILFCSPNQHFLDITVLFCLVTHVCISVTYYLSFF